jgi:hypothetical protein
MTTRRPFGSVCISYDGNLTLGAASGRGGRSVGQCVAGSDKDGIGGGTAGSGCAMARVGTSISAAASAAIRDAVSVVASVFLIVVIVRRQSRQAPGRAA